MSDKEKEEFVAAIRRNTVECMQTLMENMFKLGLNVEDPSLQEAAEELAEIDSNADLTVMQLYFHLQVGFCQPCCNFDSLCLAPVQPELANKISALWNDPGVQATFARRGTFFVFEFILRRL